MIDITFAVNTMKQIIVQGIPVSFYILIVTMLISIPLGFLVGLARYKKVPVLSQIITLLVSFFRGTPLIILIFLLYSALPDTINRIVSDHGWNINVYDAMLGNVKMYAVFICCTFSIATLSEIFRSALMAVNKNQMEAAHSVGLTTLQGYIYIIIPQAIVSAIPNLANEVVGLFKGTSLIFYMGVQDIMGVAKANAGVSYRYVEAYLDVLIVYVVLCYVMQRLFSVLERKMSKYNYR